MLRVLEDVRLVWAVIIRGMMLTLEQTVMYIELGSLRESMRSRIGTVNGSGYRGPHGTGGGDQASSRYMTQQHISDLDVFYRCLRDLIYVISRTVRGEDIEAISNER